MGSPMSGKQLSKIQTARLHRLFKGTSHHSRFCGRNKIKIGNAFAGLIVRFASVIFQRFSQRKRERSTNIMLRKRILVSAIGVLLLLNLVVAARIYSSAPRSERDNAYAHIEMLVKVMELIRKDYVDGEKLSYRDLTYGALKGMLSSLDPHSQFMDPDTFSDMKEDTEGEFGGLGIMIGVKDGFLTIIAPMDDTPGYRAGLLPGDRIIKIDGRPTEKMTLPEAVRLLRGVPGTKVTISLLRPKLKEVKDVTIERAKIRVDSVRDINGKNVRAKDSFPLMENNIGYIRIGQFSEPTADEFEQALQKLEAAGMDALVLDLRSNPGGLLESARQVASKFLPPNTVIVSTEGRNPNQIQKYRSSGKPHPNYPIVVLINNGSASGAEIVAGALQDLKRAVVVGETSFGKGSVQSILSLPDGSAVRLTTAKYYTPSRKVIHEHGITPDIIVPVSEEEQRKLLTFRARSGLPLEEGEKLEPVQDVQLERAIDLLKGIKLYAHHTKTPIFVARTKAAEAETTVAAEP
jgi:carboxyl-terminal processing protease